jgi:hypothetical protein
MKLPVIPNYKKVHDYTVPTLEPVKVLTDYERFVEIDEKFKAEEIEGFETDTKKYRLFIAQGQLCYFKKGSGKRGFMLNSSDVKNFKKYIFKKEISADEKAWKIIDKYRRYASEATFTNKFIRSCISLPKTFEEWIEGGKKCLYDYHITTGVANEGNVITVESINFMNVASIIKERRDLNSSGRYDFRNYEASLWFRKNEDGDYEGALSMEYKGCGNGHYYLLINDNCFIYYDKD